MIRKCIGEFPRYMLLKAKDSDRLEFRKYFSRDLHLKWPENASSSSSERRVREAVPLNEALEKADTDSGLLDLLKKMFTIDPDARITAEDAIKHPFFDSLRKFS